MIKLKNVLILFCSLLVITGCTGDFEEVNSDPNRIEEISPGTLLNPIIYGLAAHNAGRSNAITFDLVQVSVPFPSVSGGLHRYDVSANIGSSSWNNYYKWLKNIEEMRIASEKREDANYKAIALTLNAWVYASLTDLFGPVPMTEALKAEEEKFYPAFDTQEFIYKKILKDLEEANSLYNDKPMVYLEDILFKNDITRWRKFTNSLHMRLLLRISNRSETNAFQKLTTMINDPNTYPVFESTEESAILQVTGVGANISPWGRPQDFRLSKKMTTFFTDNLNILDDPRRAIIMTNAVDLDNNEIGYKGIPSAYEGPESQFTFNASTFNIAQVTNPMKIYLLPYSEVEFIKAEMAQRGYIVNAQEHYEKGVTAAMQQQGAVLPEAYFNNPEASYDGSLERIMLQKYFALYFVDYQQYSEYRRTGFPQLPKTSTMFNDGIMPVRFYYPSDLGVENPNGYKQAIELLGGKDDINTKIWWDKE